jgi:peptidoglycan/LPS O-acetylase OafA/YrhL
MKYLKQLDSLRAFAVVLVIISHWVPGHIFLNRIFLGSLGGIGVDIFFVLSGFLITAILFNNRNKAEELNISKSALVKNFYIRRTLRIFPIYYLIIFSLLIFQKNIGSNIQPAFIYFATYTSNFYFYNTQEWDGMLSHLWSLAVEEQFYLLWPWLILFINKKYYLHIIIGFILIGIVTEYLLRDVKMGHILTFTCFDAFGLGALLSWVITFKSKTAGKFYSGVSICAIAAGIFFVLGILQKQWIYLSLRMIVSIITLWVISYMVLNQSSRDIKFKFLFNNKVLIFLGKISYGLYLYHNLIPQLLNAYVESIFPDFLFKNYNWQMHLIVNSIILILVSWVSFILIEKRFLNLKKYFEYRTANSAENSAVKLPYHQPPVY